MRQYRTSVPVVSVLLALGILAASCVVPGIADSPVSPLSTQAAGLSVAAASPEAAATPPASTTPDSSSSPVPPDASVETGRRVAPDERIFVPILMYHHLMVLDRKAGNDWRELTVSPAAFDEQMAYLATHGYHTIGFDDLIAYFNEGRPLPDKPVIVSFDDAWEDCYTVAYPSLKKHALTGTFFIPTNWIGAVKNALTWPQIEEMSKAGMQFGSHTMTHPYLTKEKPAAMTRELGDSKAALETHLGKPVTALAYPFGLYDKRVIEATAKAGYVMGVTIERGSWQARDGLFTLQRTGITYPMTIKMFAQVLDAK